MVGIYCAGGHSKTVIEALARSGEPVDMVVDDDESVLGTTHRGHEVRRPEDDVLEDHDWIVANGVGSVRALIADQITTTGGECRSFVDRDAVVDVETDTLSHVYVSAGCYVCAEVTLGANVLLDGGVYVGHETTVGPNVTLAPNTTLGGDVEIGANSFVGLGSTVRPDVSIGSDVVVGAGATVVDDVPSNTVVVGTPAEKVRDIEEVTSGEL
ncbi:hypothetical protein RYH80_06960 [Halobaculum sp. MBLA0147]|uniref:DapH/DapD/GlmU-related protein n=1 Tax=Halobaculum sp. MBLA0147 TaxID=3079934 RepID=UPI0035261700